MKEEYAIPSMAVSQTGDLFYNKEWVEDLNEHEMEGVLTHEVLHVVLDHLTRLGGREHQLFNIANDLAINDILVTEGMELPKGGVIPSNHRFKIGDYELVDINKKTSEQIYDELYKQFKKQKNPNPSDGDIESLDKGRFDEHRYGDKEGKDKSKEKLTESQLKKIKNKWKDVLAEATNYAKQRGLLPAGMERLVDNILEGKVNWRSKLYKYITKELPYDMTWSKPNKKGISSGIYLPSVVKEKIKMVVAVDTSGSIRQKELSEFLSEVCYIARSFNNLQMWLLVCDAKIHQEYEITNGNIEKILNLKIGGGGGTSHKPIVDWVLNKKPDTKLLISLTDGYSDIDRYYNQLYCHKLIDLTENGCSEETMLPYGEVIKLR